MITAITIERKCNACILIVSFATEKGKFCSRPVSCRED